MESRHFVLSQLADGIWAAMAKPDSGSWCNAGVVDLGDRTLIFDTFATTAAARELRTAAEQLTGHSVQYLVNSHYHLEHAWSNHVYADAAIIATAATRELIGSHGVRDFERYRTLPESEVGPDLFGALGAMNGLTLPNLTFEGRLSLHGSRRRVELIECEPGHARGELILWLPEERILFTGDLITYRQHPWMADPQCDPAAWLRTLARIADLAPATVLPGHGVLGGPEAVEALTAYVSLVSAQAREALAAGTAPAELAQRPSPAAYEAWRFPQGFGRNLQAVYRRQAGS